MLFGCRTLVRGSGNRRARVCYVAANLLCNRCIKFKSYKSSQSVFGKRVSSGTHLLIMFSIKNVINKIRTTVLLRHEYLRTKLYSLLLDFYIVLWRPFYEFIILICIVVQHCVVSNIQSIRNSLSLLK